MRSDIVRSPEYQKRLCDFISAEYGIRVRGIVPAKRGYYGETWKIEASEGMYFAKLDYLPKHQIKFRGSLAVMDYLCSKGIDFISRVVRTQGNALCLEFGSAVLGLFDWIDGENLETDATKTPEYRLMCNVYRIPRPDFEMPTIEFTDGAAKQFYAQWESLKSAAPSDSNRAVLELLDSYEGEIRHFAGQLERMAALCSGYTGDFYITHGDAGGNFFVGRDKYYIFDWDEVMYAPLERDAWVMCCCDWARKLFDDTLAANGIPYRLRPERLAFFCYHMFFFYLGEFMTDQEMYDMSGRMGEFMRDGWIRERMQFADEHFVPRAETR